MIKNQQHNNNNNCLINRLTQRRIRITQRRHTDVNLLTVYLYYVVFIKKINIAWTSVCLKYINI